MYLQSHSTVRSNNTNKLSPQEQHIIHGISFISSNNTNKLSPQEHGLDLITGIVVQIIQINLVLKNTNLFSLLNFSFK